MAVVNRVLPTEVSDAAIIERSLSEPENFATVFHRYYAPIHGFAGRRLGPGLADDVAAETFLIAFDRRERYDLSRADARPWLYGIASNLISRHHRAEVRQYRALARTVPLGIAESHADRVVTRLDAEAHRGPLMAALAERAASTVPTPERARRVRLPRMGLRFAVAGGLALAVAAAAVVASGLGGADESGRPRSLLPGAPVASAQAALYQAADRAGSRAFTPPRPGQWTTSRPGTPRRASPPSARHRRRSHR